MTLVSSTRSKLHSPHLSITQPDNSANFQLFQAATKEDRAVNEARMLGTQSRLVQFSHERPRLVASIRR